MQLMQKYIIDIKILIFLSLGPTACLIANELKDEFVCWDTGHIFEFAASNFFETLINKSE